MRTQYGTALLALIFVALCAPAPAADLVKGKIVDDVACAADSSQHYALFLPSSYVPEKKWPVILLFDAGGRGRRGVERYQAAAEKYGYILAGSNNSRNGPMNVSSAAAEAMLKEFTEQYSINPTRIYSGGMSGGARVAMWLALTHDKIAGVFASSAGFPNGFFSTVGFPLFGSAGTDDFNFQEMRRLDLDLRSPHRIQYFDGGHTWLPETVATEGIEWMELQAMHSGARERDTKLIDAAYSRRSAALSSAANDFEKMRELKAIAADFDALKDVSSLKAQASDLAKQPSVKNAPLAIRMEREQEMSMEAELTQLRDQMLGNPSGFERFKPRFLALTEDSQASADSLNRRMARRVLAGFKLSSRGFPNPQFQQLLDIKQP